MRMSPGPNARSLRSPGLPLDALPRGHGIVTTITGNRETGQENSMWHSRGSSQERLALPDNIMKQVVVEYDEIDYSAKR